MKDAIRAALVFAAAAVLWFLALGRLFEALKPSLRALLGWPP